MSSRSQLDYRPNEPRAKVRFVMNSTQRIWEDSEL
jgi:hypothetical protein